MALWAGFGVVVLIARRVSTPRIRAVTSRMDVVVLVVIAVQIGTGIWTALAYRWGSSWGPSVMTPYIRSLIRFDPSAEFVSPLPFMIKAHVVSFYVFLVVFPFSRLVHIVTLPLGYLTRSWQKVVRNTPSPGVYHPANR